MDILIIITLLLIAAETTYLSVSTIKRTSAKITSQPIFVDTSVLIDGRIIAVAQSGFITSTLFIPRSVIGELQLLADTGDAEKRSRARHGLDIVSELQALENAKVEIFPDGERAAEGVDNRLLSLAKKHHGSICTIDYNLNKVAVVEHIPVLNVNDLAKNLRMAYLPGERVLIELTQKGNDASQAVGHLSDGTMVVVEHGSSHMGQSVEVEFTRGLQTAAGRMMFARVVQSQSTPAATQKPRPKNESRSRTRNTAQPPKKERQSESAQPRGNRRRPNDREENLIDLVNKQQD
ncbi:MAG: putative PilT domain containing protein [Candidatus Saccharibacteria bacterium]|nr:putative PilT domain containing protein [Candidatus Saccharibacteria bacterium]